MEMPLPYTGLRRRAVLLGGQAIVFAAAIPIDLKGLSAQQGSEAFDVFLSNISRSDQIVGDNRAYREAFQLPPSGLEQAPTRARPSSTKISTRARALILAFEVSSEAAYRSKYALPIWPGGESGVTIGIGYDIGYTRDMHLEGDWQSYLDLGSINALKAACGLKGRAAKDVAVGLANVAISWEIAEEQFREMMVPRYVGIAERALPNFRDLSEDCRGALVSLVYNRGASFGITASRDPSGRYEEMRNIRVAMRNKTFETIPTEIRKMKRLWSAIDLPGLHKRRDAEALLFEIGLG